VRRVLAALAALIMISGGFAVWAARTGRFSNDSATTTIVTTGDSTVSADEPRLTIACIPEAEAACAAIGDITDVGFSVEPPSITEKQIGAKSAAAPDGWITTALGYERVRLVNDSFRDPIDVASTRIAVVTRPADTSPAATCKADLACLSSTGRVSFPSVSSSGTGLSIATTASLAGVAAGEPAPISVEEIPDGDAIVSALRRATKPSGNDPLTSLTSVRLLDAVVLPEVRVRNLAPQGVEVTAAKAAPPVSLVLILPKSVSTTRAKAIATSVRAALLANGWDVPTSPRSLPNAGIANELVSALS
jgi:hypothetical protein